MATVNGIDFGIGDTTDLIKIWRDVKGEDFSSDALRELVPGIPVELEDNDPKFPLIAARAVKKKGAKDFAYVSEEDLEAVFTGRPWDMLALCYKVFEVNFLDFSKSSSVPIGVQKALSEIKTMFQGVSGNTSAE
jgi:hypothetical protein